MEIFNSFDKKIVNVDSNNFENLKKEIEGEGNIFDPEDIKKPLEMRDGTVVENSDSFLDKIIDGLKDLFKPKDYGYGIKIINENGVYTATEPDTEEFKDHNSYMQSVSDEYDKMHPAPPKLENQGILGDGREYSKWEREKNEYMKAQEKIYRENNPEYKAQAEAYEKAKKEISLMV